jgi:uncharacterized membrane protein YfcA
MPEPALVLVVTFVALFVSSVAGYGGSLVLVPALAAILGPKEGIAVAALLLGWNNVFKVLAYRHTLALRRGWPLVVVTAAGVWVGARVLVESSDRVIMWAIIAVTAASLLVEIVVDGDRLRMRRHVAVPAMAASSVLSGISGSSGPLKGIAIRSLNLPRLEHVGAAATVSLVADAFKVELFASAGLLRGVHVQTLLVALPMMPVGAWVGRWVNRRIDEEAFRWVFWTVVGGYTMRMAGVWL